MKDSQIFKFTEKLLFNYASNIKKFHRLQHELNAIRSNGDIHAQSYQPSNNSGFSNPVLDHVERVLNLEAKLARLKRDIIPVMRLIRELTQNKSNKAKDFIILLREFYSNKHSLKEISIQIKKSLRTLYSRRRELVQKTAGYF